MPSCKNMEKLMSEAFIEARLSLAEGEVPVGCVFVLDEEIIARGGNSVNVTKNPTRHAELVCIDQVLEYCSKKDLKYQDVFTQLIVIVTVEPCIMCLSALHDLNVKEILFGCANNRFGGKTVVDVPKIIGRNISIRGGIRAEEAMDLLKVFYKGQNPSAPIANLRR